MYVLWLRLMEQYLVEVQRLRLEVGFKTTTSGLALLALLTELSGLALWAISVRLGFQQLKARQNMKRSILVVCKVFPLMHYY